MFTGIVTDIGTVKKASPRKGGVRLVVATRLPLNKISLGASIACAGVCLTVVEKGKGWFAADVSPETLRCTNIGSWKEGTKLNVEGALKAGDELGGHIVSGHVDGLAMLKKATPEGENYKLTVMAPRKLMRYIAPKGSITLDGVSLTVNKVKTDSFTVNIIPHTWEVTTFGKNKKGDMLHLEVDMLARYAARLLGIKRRR